MVAFQEQQMQHPHTGFASAFELGASHEENRWYGTPTTLCKLMHLRSREWFQKVTTLHSFGSEVSADYRVFRHATNQRRRVWEDPMLDGVGLWLVCEGGAGIHFLGEDRVGAGGGREI